MKTDKRELNWLTDFPVCAFPEYYLNCSGISEEGEEGIPTLNCQTSADYILVKMNTFLHILWRK